MNVPTGNTDTGVGVGVSNPCPSVKTPLPAVARKCTAVTCGPRARLGYRRARAHNRVSGANPRRSPSAAAGRHPPDAGSCACGPLINKRQQRAPGPRARAHTHTCAHSRVYCPLLRTQMSRKSYSATVVLSRFPSWSSSSSSSRVNRSGIRR